MNPAAVIAVDVCVFVFYHDPHILSFKALLDPRADEFLQDIHHYDSRQAPTSTPWAKTYGTAGLGLGLDLTAEAWPNLTQVFRSEATCVPYDTPGRPACRELTTVERTSLDILKLCPVDVLVVGDLTETRERAWLTRVEHGTKPTLVLEFWDDEQMFKEADPYPKGWRHSGRNRGTRLAARA
jgi:hypothetical protein